MQVNDDEGLPVVSLSTFGGQRKLHTLTSWVAVKFRRVRNYK
jgi:hypothetical protein